MPQQLSSLESSSRRESTLKVLFFHTSCLLSALLEKQKELKRQRIKEEDPRNSEKLEEGTKVKRTVSGSRHYQRIQCITNPPMVLDSAEGTVKAGSPHRPPQQCLPGRRAPAKLSAKSSRRKMLSRAGLHHSQG